MAKYAINWELVDKTEQKHRLKGAVAQLGERYNGIVEVRGSIPLGSTNLLMISVKYNPSKLHQLQYKPQT